jgi:hypothetical protein
MPAHDIGVSVFAIAALVALDGCAGGMPRHDELAASRGCRASPSGEISCDNSVVAVVACEGRSGSSCRSLGVRYLRDGSTVWLQRNAPRSGKPGKVDFAGAFHVTVSGTDVWFTKPRLTGGSQWYRYDLSSGDLAEWSDPNAWETIHEKIRSGTACWLERPRE